MEIKPIAVIHNDFKEKFGIPRQSGILDKFLSTIVFEKEFRDENALRGIEEFSHLWLIWGFSKAERKTWSPTVRPPRLGGNKRIGVFATRSPFRPNSLGLSSVELKEVKKTENGTVLIVSGADLLDGTPIYDIKPYLEYTDSHKETKGGFTDEVEFQPLKVEFCSGCDKILKDKKDQVIAVLENDPRPSYQADGKEYGLRFGEFEIKFTVENEALTVCNIVKYDKYTK